MRVAIEAVTKRGFREYLTESPAAAS
jgi:hypothetical protein